MWAFNILFEFHYYVYNFSTGPQSHSKFRQNNNNHGFSTLPFIFSTGHFSFAVCHSNLAKNLKVKKVLQAYLGCWLLHEQCSYVNFPHKTCTEDGRKNISKLHTGIWGEAILNTMSTIWIKNVKYPQSCNASG